MNRPNWLTRVCLVLFFVIVALTIFGGLSKAFAQTPQRPEPFKFQLPLRENRAFVPTYPVDIRVVNEHVNPLPSGWNPTADVNPGTYTQVLRYDEYGNLIEFMAYTDCNQKGGSVLCHDWNGLARIYVPQGKYLALVQAYPYRVRWVEFEVFGGPAATFVQAQLFASPLRQWIDMKLSVQGSDLKGSFQVAKKEPGEYDAKIELRAYGPGLGSFAWVGFTPKTWERKLDDANPTTTVEFEITIPSGLPKGYQIFVEVTGMLKNNGFVQDAWGFNTVTVR